jgi:hypothetical protein
MFDGLRKVSAGEQVAAILLFLGIALICSSKCFAQAAPVTIDYISTLDQTDNVVERKTHTSIIATLRQEFGLGGPLTARDNVAPTLRHALTLRAPTNDGPLSINAARRDVSLTVLREWANRPPNNYQEALSRMAKLLPSQPLVPGAPLPPPPQLTPSGFNKAIAAGHDAMMRLKSFLGV